jgi:hypothetical protein
MQMSRPLKAELVATYFYQCNRKPKTARFARIHLIHLEIPKECYRRMVEILCRQANLMRKNQPGAVKDVPGTNLPISCSRRVNAQLILGRYYIFAPSR